MTGYLFRSPWSTPESRAGQPPRPRTEKLPGMLIENGGLVYKTYFDVARRYLFRPHDALRHPHGRAPARQAG